MELGNVATVFPRYALPNLHLIFSARTTMMRIPPPSTAATAHNSQNSLPDNAGTSNAPSVAQHTPSPPAAPGLFQSGWHWMKKFNLVPQKRFGPLTFVDQLGNDMSKAGCSNRSIEKFKKLFANPDPESLYAQNILADLEANR